MGEQVVAGSRPEHRQLVECGLLLGVAPFLLFPTYRPALTALALGLLLVSWLLPGRSILPATPFTKPLLLWCVALLGAIAVTADPDLTLPKATGLILGLAVWRFMAVWLDSPGRVKLALIAFGLVGGGFLLVGLFSANWQFEVAFVQKLFPALPPRLITLPEANDGVHTNELAAVILFYLPLAAALLGWGGRRRGWWGLALIVLGGLLLLTQSRSGWLGGLAGLAVLPLLFGRTRPGHWLILLVVVGLLLAAGLLAWPALAPTLPQETAIGTLQTVPFRFEVWRWGLAALHDFPLTGPGLGTFRRVVFRFYPIQVPAYYDIAHAHNIFLQVALDSGLPGLLAYGWLLGVMWGTGRELGKREDWLRPVALGLLGGLIALHTYGLTDALAPGSKPFLLFWLLLGLLTACGRVMGRNRG